jgi:hypothetical protein
VPAKSAPTKPVKIKPLQVFHTSLMVAAAVSGVYLIGQVAWCAVWHISFPYEAKGWAEGHFLYNALQLSRGDNIYADPSKQPVTAWPYGFLYPVLMAPLVRLFGPELWIGRAVSTAAACLSLGWVYQTAAGRARSPIAGACGVLLAFTTYPLSVYCWDWGHCDSLYMALGLASLMCVERLEPGARSGRIALAVVLSCASCCAKQTGGAFILAIATSLLIRYRRLGFAYLVGSISLMAATWTVWHFVSDGQFERYMILPISDPYQSDWLAPMARLLVFGAPLLLLAAGWQVKRDFPRSRWGDPVIWALIWEGSACIAGTAKHGGALNSLMPLFFLLSVPAGVRLSEMVLARTHAGAYRTAALIALLGQLLLTHFTRTANLAAEYRQLGRLIRHAGRLIDDELRDPNERVLMGARVSFAVRRGHTLYDAFTMAGGNARFVAGRVTGEFTSCIQNRLRRQISERFFDKLLVPKDSLEFLPADLVQLLFQKYRVDHVIQKDDYVWLYAPMLVLKPVRS